MCRIVPWASCTICLVRPQTQDYTYIYVFVFVFVRVFILMNTCDTFCRFAFCSHLLAWNKSNYKSTIRKKKVCTAPFLKISSFFSCCFHSIFAVAVCVNMNGSHVTWHATNHGTNHDVHLQIENCREKKNKQNYNYAFANATTFHESNWRYWHAFFAVCFIGSLLTWMAFVYGCRIEFIGICNELDTYCPISAWHGAVQIEEFQLWPMCGRSIDKIESSSCEMQLSNATCNIHQKMVVWWNFTCICDGRRLRESTVCGYWCVATCTNSSAEYYCIRFALAEAMS